MFDATPEIYSPRRERATLCRLPLEPVLIPSNVIEQHIITNLNCAINNT